MVETIQELRMATVDGHGTQDLVAMQSRDGGTSVAVRRWRILGHSLIWQGVPGSFQRIELLAGNGTASPSLAVA